MADLDREGLMFARTHVHDSGTVRAVAAYSRLGEHGACWLVLGCVGGVLDRDVGRRRAWRRGAQTVAIAYALNYGVKILVRRRRPSLPDLPPLTHTVSQLSFPSAHATTSFAAARAFSAAGLAPVLPLYGAAIAFGLSRPYLGVHYPSDVLAGAVLGTVVGSR